MRTEVCLKYSRGQGQGAPSGDGFAGSIPCGVERHTVLGVCLFLCLSVCLSSSLLLIMSPVLNPNHLKDLNPNDLLKEPPLIAVVTFPPPQYLMVRINI